MGSLPYGKIFSKIPGISPRPKLTEVEDEAEDEAEIMEVVVIMVEEAAVAVEITQQIMGVILHRVSS